MHLLSKTYQERVASVSQHSLNPSNRDWLSSHLGTTLEGKEKRLAKTQKKKNLIIFQAEAWVLRCRSGGGQELRRINTCHRSYDPLHYVLRFPSGCDGWHLGLTKSNNKTHTAVDFYVFRFQVRLNDFNIV